MSIPLGFQMKKLNFRCCAGFGYCIENEKTKMLSKLF